MSDIKDIGEILESEARDSKLPCAKVFDLISRHTVFPDIAGMAMNQRKLKITQCQLGLFGYPDGKRIPVCDTVQENLKVNIDRHLEDGRISCLAVWGIAEEMKLSRGDVAAACEKLGIRVNKCQLGAF